MAERIEMVQLSPTMEEGTLVVWHKKKGDTVEIGDVIAEVETDKATMEMESFFDGTVLEILVAEGETAAVGSTLAIVGEEGEDISDMLDGDSDADGSDDGSDDDGADEAEADEADSSDDDDSTDESGDDAGSRRQADDGGSSDRKASGDDGRRLRASPLARRIARDEGVDLSSIDGSGPAGRIIKRDVEQALRDGAAAKKKSPRAQAPAAPSGEGEKVALSAMRKTIARRLTEAWEAPAFMLTRELRVDALMTQRQALNDKLAERDAGKVSVNDIVIKAAARALVDVPEMNAAFGGDHIFMYGTVDIGVAVAVDGGLITPVIRQADKASLTEIAQRVRDLAGRAREKKLQPEEYTGATFSISNLGMFGIDHFTAVLNPPAAGILAVGAVRNTPVVGAGGELEAGQVMTVTLTCDHRTVDGVVGAKWLQAFAAYIETPLMLLA